MTGYLGLIGSVIRHNLQGFEWVGYDLKESNDILDTDKLIEKLKGCSACVHLAGIPAPIDLPWEDFEKTNIQGTLSVIKACTDAKVNRLVYMSSGCVYGFSSSSCKPDQLPMKEDNTPVDREKLHYYDISKIECEKHIEEASRKYDLTGIVLRLDTPTPYAPVLPSHLFVSIKPSNLAEAIRASLKADFKGFGVFNIADPEITEFPQTDIQKWIKENYPDIPNYTQGRQSLFDITKVRTILGYNPT